MVELTDEIPSVKAAWESHKIEYRIVASKCPTKGEYTYPKLMEAFVMKHYKEFYPDYATYNNAPSLAHMKGLALRVGGAESI